MGDGWPLAAEAGEDVGEVRELGDPGAGGGRPLEEGRPAREVPPEALALGLPAERKWDSLQKLSTRLVEFYENRRL